jgi:hypothetical protein
MVTDGTWSLIDVLYIFATANSTDALLNLVSTSYDGTAHNGPTFTADQGFTGDGVSTWIDTGFNPNTAGGNFTLNSASFGAYDRTSDTTGSVAAMGVYDGTTGDNLFPLINPSAGLIYTINVTSGSDNFVTNSNAQGLWIVSRTSSTSNFLRKDGASFFTNSSDPTTGASLPNFDFVLLANNNSGTISGNSGDQYSAAFIGGGLTTTQADAVASRINAYMTAVGANVY